MNRKTSPCLMDGTCPEKANFNLTDSFGIRTERPKLLLHSCCGPCSTAVIERLIADYSITVFFYNPNITEREEYERRLEAQRKVIDYFNGGRAVIIDRIDLLEGGYDREDFFNYVRGLEDEPEGGERCRKCFELRLMATADRARLAGFDVFGTTLTVSPHKSYPLIAALGRSIAEIRGIPFLDMDMKKKGGFMRSIELSREMGIYRQNYCGCVFSRWFDKKI